MSADASPWIVDVNVTNFEQDVILRSDQVPVVVDFWATWCEPCKTLGPLLERYANELKGAFVLAKVDTDANPELAQAFRIQGVPTVVAISKGQPVDGFTGNLPAGELKEFIERIAPGGAAADPLADAKLLEEDGQAGKAIELLRAWLDEHSDAHEVRIELARLLIDAERAADAREVFDGLPEDQRESAAARAVLAKLEIASGAGDVSALEAQVAADPADHGARIELGKSLVAVGRHDDGLEHLLEVVKADRSFDDDAARKAMLDVFEALGDEHAATKEFRQLLQMILLV